jgi:hypothetical protein
MVRYRRASPLLDVRYDISALATKEEKQAWILGQAQGRAVGEEYLGEAADEGEEVFESLSGRLALGISQ